MISKIAGGALFAGLLGVGGIAITKPYLLGMDHMPEFHTLDKDHDFQDITYSSGKFANKYTKYLTGVAKEKGDKGKTHQDWWEWAYRRLSKDENRSKNGKFKDVVSGYGEDAVKHLSKVCKEAYGKQDSDFHSGNNENTENKYTKDEVWKYCSVGGTKPTTIKEFNENRMEGKEEYSSGKTGNGDDQISKLLSTKDKNNDWVWNLKDKEFGGMNVDQGYFKTEKSKENRKSLKDICQEAYKSEEKTDSNGNNLKKTDVVKYCSLEGK